MIFERFGREFLAGVEGHRDENVHQVNAPSPIDKVHSKGIVMTGSVKKNLYFQMQ